MRKYMEYYPELMQQRERKFVVIIDEWDVLIRDEALNQEGTG